MDFSIVTLDEQIDDALGVLKDVLFGVDPRDKARLRDVVAQSRSRYRTALVQNGIQTASLHAGRGLSLVGHLGEVLGGLPQLRCIEPIHAAFDEKGPELMDRIEAIREFVATRPFVASFTGSDGVREKVKAALTEWSGRTGKAGRGMPTFEPYGTPPREGLAGAMQVAYCIRLLPAPHYSDEKAPLISLGSHIVNYDYAVQEIRLKGTAYGGGFRYDPIGRMIMQFSFRDPHVARTLGVHDGALDFVRKVDWTQVDIDRAIIAVAKHDETPIRPRSATSTALGRHLIGLTPEMRERRFARLKTAKPAEVKDALIRALEAGAGRAPVCVVSSREKLEAANKELGDRALSIEDILGSA
jgi:Zn-dependent M16 (insulinase) family peptidase